MIAIEAVPGVVPATDARFELADPGLRERLEPGQVAELSFERRDATLRLLGFEVVGRASAADGWVLLGDQLVRADPGGPDFRLVDQAGRPFDSAELRGRIVLLDFIFTTCHGPCPAQTQTHVQVQRALSAPARARSWFVSITIDPEHDDAEALRAYADRHGVDLSDWSFLTGEPEEVKRIVRAWAVGTQPAEDGQFDHTLVTYLVDERGRIVRRYRGEDHDPQIVVSDIEALAGSGPPKTSG